MKIRLTTIVFAALLSVGSASAHSKAIKPEYVDMLLAPYFELQVALAKDDLAVSQASAATFKKMLGHGPSHAEAASLADLSEQADKIIAASDLKAARGAFHAISKDLAKMVEHIGTSGKSDVLKMRCPMAFGGKGGIWLQDGDDLANPYYGAAMYKCGAVQKTLALAKEATGRDDHGAKEEEHHDHGAKKAADSHEHGAHQH